MIPEIIILALIMVESSGRDDVFGDHGKAAGCLQIHACVISDVNRIYGMAYTWPDSCLDRAASIEICRLYLTHYAPRNATPEILSRIWNGGPNGMKKKATNIYWKKVEIILTQHKKDDTV